MYEAHALPNADAGCKSLTRMSGINLTHPEYLMLRLLAEIRAPVALDGEAIDQLRRDGLVQQIEGGILITELGLQRAAMPF